MKNFILGVTISLAALSIYILKDEIPLLLSATYTYDSYVFAVQWGATLCKTRGESCWNKLERVPKNSMTIHGLWPSMKSGVRLPDCNSGEPIEIEDDGSEVFNQMKTYWPSLTGPSESFWGHEYNKHGYCYSEKIEDFDYKKYFQKTIEIFKEKNIDTLILDTIGVPKTGDYSMDYNDFYSIIKEKIGGNYFALTCKTISKKQYLQEIRFTLDLDFNYISLNMNGNCSKNKAIYLFFRSP